MSPACANPLAGLNLAALQAYLSSSGFPITGELTATMITGGRSNLTYRVSDEVTSWVLRRPPTAGLTPSAHDVGREYRIVHALQSTKVPVPPTLMTCPDPSVIGAPFTLVGFVPGRVLRTQADLETLSDTELNSIHRELIRVLAELHAVDYASAGLADFGRPSGYADRQIALWRRQWDRVATRELPDLDLLYAALQDRPPRSSGPAGIVHGDFRIDNTLLDPHRVDRMVALVDWEMSTIGDPVTDVAMMCAYQHGDFDHVVGEPGASTSGRWPDAAAIAADYADVSGRDLGDFGAYLGLAFLKLAVIAEGISARHHVGVGTGAGYATAGLAVPGLVSAGLAALAGTG